ncbi:hypothetical protein ACTSKR_07560 [Chitinibacteraceae bacterium HSL-7]
MRNANDTISIILLDRSNSLATLQHWRASGWTLTHIQGELYRATRNEQQTWRAAA